MSSGVECGHDGGSAKCDARGCECRDKEGRAGSCGFLDSFGFVYSCLLGMVNGDLGLSWFFPGVGSGAEGLGDQPSCTCTGSAAGGAQWDSSICSITMWKCTKLEYFHNETRPLFGIEYELDYMKIYILIYDLTGPLTGALWLQASKLHIIASVLLCHRTIGQ